MVPAEGLFSTWITDIWYRIGPVEQENIPM